MKIRNILLIVVAALSNVGCCDLNYSLPHYYTYSEDIYITHNPLPPRPLPRPIPRPIFNQVPPNNHKEPNLRNTPNNNQRQFVNGNRERFNDGSRNNSRQFGGTKR